MPRHVGEAAAGTGRRFRRAVAMATVAALAVAPPVPAMADDERELLHVRVSAPAHRPAGSEALVVDELAWDVNIRTEGAVVTAGLRPSPPTPVQLSYEGSPVQVVSKGRVRLPSRFRDDRATLGSTSGQGEPRLQRACVELVVDSPEPSARLTRVGIVALVSFSGALRVTESVTGRASCAGDAVVDRRCVVHVPLMLVPADKGDPFTVQIEGDQAAHCEHGRRETVRP